MLGIEIPKAVEERSKLLLEELPTEIEMKELTSQRLEDVLREVSSITIGTNTDLDMREFLGIDKALTRIKGELQNNTSKLSEVDEQVKGIREELKNSQDPQEQKELKARLRELQQERKVRLEIASQNHKELTSQIARIRETLYDLRGDDLSLREKSNKSFENTA